MSGRTRTWWLAGGLIVIGLAVFVLIETDAAQVLPGARDDEFRRLVAIVPIEPGMRVAEIGAGSGWLAVKVAAEVGPAGAVLATELGGALAGLRATVAGAGAANVTVLEAAEASANLPASCCDVVYMRYVYHHVTEPAALLASLREALKPGGRLAIIDFAPSWWLSWLVPTHGGADDRGHGIGRDALAAELAGAGFEPVHGPADWRRNSYLVIVRRPVE